MDSKKYYAPGHDWFVKNNLTPPTTISHGTEGDIRDNLKSTNPTNWRMEGNKLIADTELGRLVQSLPTDVILTGVDAKGNPVFKKVDI